MCVASRKNRKIRRMSQSGVTKDDMTEQFNIMGCFHDIENCVEMDNFNKAKERSDRKEEAKYGSGKKPKWWLRQYAGGNNRGTKAQRRARTRLATTYCVPEIRHGSGQLSVSDLFRRSINKEDDVWVEIGFGDGQVLRQNAMNHPDRVFIGADLHLPGVGKVLLDMEKHDNEDCDYKYESNLRIYAGDGIKLVRHCPDKSLSCILMTFPDPMINDSKWRIVQDSTLKIFEQKLKDCGMFILATDAIEFAAWTVQIFEKHSSNWKKIEPPHRNEWLPIKSKYEVKGEVEGRVSTFNCWKLDCKL